MGLTLDGDCADLEGVSLDLDGSFALGVSSTIFGFDLEERVKVRRSVTGRRWLKSKPLGNVGGGAEGIWKSSKMVVWRRENRQASAGGKNT